MLFDSESKPHLRAWLVRTLEPICDADPGALADYVAALLERDISEADLRKDLTSSLEEFLEKDGPPFIDSLFSVLRTKSYIPYAATSDTATSTPSGDAGIPIPFGATPSHPIPTGPRKRHLDEGESNGPAKGPRLGNQANGRHDRRDFSPMANGMMGSGMGPMGPMGHINPNRNGADRPKIFIPPEQLNGVCRDYHIKGYCARGSTCKYSHGDDAIIPTQMMPMGGPGMQQPFMPMFGGQQGFGGPGGSGYDPSQVHMDMRGQQRMGGMAPGLGKFHYTPRAAILPRGSDGPGGGELPVIQDLTPQAPSEEGASGDGDGSQEIPVHAQRGPRRAQEYAPPMGTMNGPRSMGGGPMGPQGMMGGMPMGMHMGMPMDVDSRPPMGMPFNGPQGGIGGGPTGMGGGPGPFPRSGAPGFGGAKRAPGEVPPGARPELLRRDKTLVVEKIPADKLTEPAVIDWFSKFGSVTKVALDKYGGKALVSFDSNDEARAAWKSEDAVFGNRFVKVFWHRPMEGQGSWGNKALAQSTNVVKSFSNGEGGASAPPKVAVNSALAEKQQRLEQQIAEQKELMARLAGASAEEKKELFAQLRKLGEEIKAATAGAPVPTVSAKPSPSPAPSKPATSASPAPGNDEKTKMEQLDKELDLHAAGGGEGGDATEALKAQLAKLKAEAASLGIADPGAPPAYGSGGYRPYRGRGRGRGYFRGVGTPARGGPPRVSMKLDNRPKRLLVKGVTAEKLQGVRDWYEAVGTLESVDTLDNGDVVVAFKTRGAAEQGIGKGTNIPVVGKVEVSWLSGPAPTPKANGGALAAIPDGADDQQMHEPEGTREDEASTSGWDADRDTDTMGMM